MEQVGPRRVGSQLGYAMNYLRHPFMGISIHSAPSIFILTQIGGTPCAKGLHEKDEYSLWGMKHILCCNSDFWLHYSRHSWPPPTSESSQKANISVWCLVSKFWCRDRTSDVIQLLQLNECVVIKVSTDENISSGFRPKWRPLIFCTDLNNNFNVCGTKFKWNSNLKFSLTRTWMYMSKMNVDITKIWKHPLK